MKGHKEVRWAEQPTIIGVQPEATTRRHIGRRIQFSLLSLALVLALGALWKSSGVPRALSNDLGAISAYRGGKEDNSYADPQAEFDWGSVSVTNYL